MPRPLRLGVVTAAALFALSAAPAHANFLAIGQDTAGDAPHPGRDIVAVGLSYDRRAGHLRGGVKLAGTPTADVPANLTLFAGHRTPTGCNGYPAIGFGTQTDLAGADWVRLDAPQSPPGARGHADKLYEAEAEEYEATATALAGRRPDCIIAQLNQPGDPAVVYDVAGPFALRALPELAAKLGSLSKALRPGRTRTVRLTLRNPGDASTGRLRLSAARARGLTVRMPRSLPALRAGAKRTVAVKVRLSQRARSSTLLRFTATGKDGLRARAEGSLYKRTPPSGAGGRRSSSKLCFKYTWLPPYSELAPC
jgi:hypothetical protein